MRLTATIFILFLCSLNLLFGQTKEEKKEFKKKFIEAEYFFLLEEYEEAAFLYEELLKSDPDNANLQFLIGASYLSVPGKKTIAIGFLENAIKSLSPSYREGSYKERNAPKESLFALAKAYHIGNQLDKAEDYYKQYKEVMQLRDVAEIEYINKQIRAVELAKKMIKDTIAVSYSNITSDFNDNDPKHHAVYSKEAEMLLYMVDRPFYSPIMMRFLEGSEWTDPVVINGQIKLDGTVNLCSVSFDGKTLLLAQKQDFNSDLYISNFEKGKWSKAVPLPEPINSVFNETHAVLSSDKKTLFFTSDRPEGQGAMDIYKIEKNKQGDWGEPQNIGKPVNGIYSEETPFITEDGKTLYFSSMSHATMGGFDIFYSTKLPDGNWSYPANLGFPISSNDDDFHYQPLNNGLQALYNGKDALFPASEFVMILPDEDTVVKPVQLKGKIIPADAGLLAANTKVELVNRETDELIASTNPDAETGEYSFEVDAGDYEIKVESEGYDSIQEDLSILPRHKAKEISVESTLNPDDVGKDGYVVAKNILFAFDSYDLSKDARFELEKMLKIMEDYPEIVLELTGHTDSIGAAAYNLQLSHRRAQSVVNYLVARGIGAERFISKGVGEQGNLAINTNPDGSDNPEGRKFNRQVEIKLLNAGDRKIWLEEYLIPKHLRPAAQKNYYVILQDSTVQIDDINLEVLGEEIKLFETGRKHIYAAGSFPDKRKAIEYLNEIIELDFPEGRIVDQEEFDYLLQPSVPDLSKVKGPFAIQLLALRNPVKLDRFSQPDIIRQYQSSDGFHRYFTGLFDKYTDAQEALVDFVLEGYTDAFIIPLARFDKSLEGKEDIIQNFDFYFTIQFSATRKPASEEFFQDIQEIVTSKGADGFYRYSTGIYLNKLEAEKMLVKIKDKGYNDAFIKKVVKNGY